MYTHTYINTYTYIHIYHIKNESMLRFTNNWANVHKMSFSCQQVFLKVLTKNWGRWFFFMDYYRYIFLKAEFLNIGNFDILSFSALNVLGGDPSLDLLPFRQEHPTSGMWFLEFSLREVALGIVMCLIESGATTWQHLTGNKDISRLCKIKPPHSRGKGSSVIIYTICSSVNNVDLHIKF